MKCPYCSYDWEPRKASPKQCPCCKRYLKRAKSSAPAPTPVIERSKAERVSEAKPKPRPFSSVRIERKPVNPHDQLMSLFSEHEREALEARKRARESAK